MFKYFNYFVLGWNVILEFLSLAAKDSAPNVISQCLDTLQITINFNFVKSYDNICVLYKCINIIFLISKNNNHQESSLRAIELIRICAKRIPVYDSSDTKEHFLDEYNSHICLIKILFLYLNF